MNNLLKIISIFSIFLISCNNIKPGKDMKGKTIDFLKSLNLLEDNEKIIKYYSNNTEESAGNFFTNKRIAHYRLDQKDSLKTEVQYAFYEDIIAIDTIFSVSAILLSLTSRLQKKIVPLSKYMLKEHTKKKNHFLKELLEIG